MTDLLGRDADERDPVRLGGALLLDPDAVTAGRSQGTERGSAPLELVLLAVPVLTVMMLIVFVGRVVRADGTLDGVAHYAALRSAEARSADDADTAARAAAASDLAASGLPCEATDVQVDTVDFRSGGTVEVTVSCQLRLSDLGPLPVPGTRLVTSRSVAAIDVFRGTR